MMACIGKSKGAAGAFFRLGLILYMAASFVGGAVTATAAGELVVVGTGERGGDDFVVGRVLCRLLARRAEDIDCQVQPFEPGDAPGSLSVLTNLHNGAADIGIAAADWQNFAVTREGPAAARFLPAPLDGLRALFSLHTETVTILARRDSGVAELDDLTGKRVNLGRPFTEQRRLVEMLMDAKGWTENDFQMAETLTPKQQSLAFCHDQVQVLVFRSSHPNPDIAQAIEICDGVLASATGTEVEKLVESAPYLEWTTIPDKLYEGAAASVKTFGFPVTVVSTADIPDDLVYKIVRTVFDNIEVLRRQHPVFSDLDPERMMKQGLSAPLHPGAERYYREIGLM